MSEDLVVRSGHAFMARYVVEALASDPGLVARMRERGARIFVVEPARIHDETVEPDPEITRALAALDVGQTQVPIYIVQMDLYRLRGRWGDGEQRRPLAVTVPRGHLLGVIALGEGGALFLSADLEPSNPVQALSQLRLLLA